LSQRFNSVVFLVFVLYSFVTFGQKFSVSGTIVDKVTGIALPFGTVRVIESNEGATSNKDGHYELLLRAGLYRVIASFVGYLSDTLEVQVKGNTKFVNFALEPSQVKLNEVTVFPGVNPALEIISRAIERKNERAKYLKSFKFGAYTKVTLKTAEDLLTSGTGGGGAGGAAAAGGTILTGGNKPGDTAGLKITGIIENVSESYFRAPSDYKEIILGRKQTANIPPIFNIITGGRFISNFYEDQVNFFANNNFTGPIANDALDYYYYYLKDTISIDRKNVFKVHIEPNDPADPGFVGNLYILDKSFDLIKVELGANKVGTVADFFDTLKFQQQFVERGGHGFYMPTDFLIEGKINYLNVFKAEIDLNTALSDYEVNIPLEDEIFSGAVIKVLSDADEKDSLFWSAHQGIPNTTEEVTAYERIDSLQNEPKSFWERFTLLSDRIALGENFTVSAPLAMYHFNPVEGNSLDFRVTASGLFNKRLNSRLDLSYGFADEKFKPELTVSYALGEYRTHLLSFSAFDRIEVLFKSNREYGKMFTTLNTLISKMDFNDYYYSRGYSFDYSGEVFPFLTVGLGVKNRTDNSAVVNSDFSVFRGDRVYRHNTPVTEMRLNEFSLGVTVDPRDYIENGLTRMRLWGKFHITGGVEYRFAPGSLSSGVDYKSYNGWLRMFLRTSMTTSMMVRVTGFTTEGGMPLQVLYSMPGNINATAQNQSFRTVRLGEYLGDRGWMLFVDQNLDNLPLRLFGISFLKKLNFRFNAFFNAGFTEINPETAALLPFAVNRLTDPFYEAGFGVSTLIIPVKVEFGWRLNHRENNAFRVGLNTIIIL